MAYEIYRPRIYGNFRQRFEKKPKTSWRNERPGMSEKHLALIRLMPCCVSLKRRPQVIVDPHHLKSGPAAAERSLQVKATDRWTVPLWRVEHDELERLSSGREKAWFYDRGIDPYDLAMSLWISTGDLERMVKVLMAHREQFAKHD